MLPEIKIFQTSDGEAKFKIRLQNDSIWLTQKQMAALFEKDSDTIGLHLKNIFNKGSVESTVFFNLLKTLYTNESKQKISASELILKAEIVLPE